MLSYFQSAFPSTGNELTQKSEDSRIKLDEAKALVKQTERPYVPHVPTWDEWDPPKYIGTFKEGEIVGYHRRNGEIAELEKEIG